MGFVVQAPIGRTEKNSARRAVGKTSRRAEEGTVKAMVLTANALLRDRLFLSILDSAANQPDSRGISSAFMVDKETIDWIVDLAGSGGYSISKAMVDMIRLGLHRRAEVNTKESEE